MNRLDEPVRLFTETAQLVFTFEGSSTLSVLMNNARCRGAESGKLCALVQAADARRPISCKHETCTDGKSVLLCQLSLSPATVGLSARVAYFWGLTPGGRNEERIGLWYRDTGGARR